jgi:class 3 adenylate cyclase/tetratricopeptide (TPR) repeat protein
MSCPNCRSESPAGAKFCAACGATLEPMVCPRCGHRANRHDRFCGGCGHALAGAVATGGPGESAADVRLASGGERRQATVLLADISGSTLLGERLDPEEVDGVVGRFRRTAVQVIEKHGGTINQFVGDEVVAVFGVPSAREDDPVRAVRAAMELHAETSRQSSELEARIGERLAIHTGINTGLMIAQYSNDREGLYRLTGDAINTAARLRSLAAADEILVGPNTQRLVKPYFEALPLPAVQRKGKGLPIVPYRVVGISRVRSRFEAASQQGLKAHVGRSRELDVLRSCLARALEGEGRFVTIEGEPGIGKSRLLHEFLRDLDREQITLPQGRCEAHATETPYFPFLDGLRRGLYLSEDEAPADALRKAVDGVRRIDPALEAYLPFYLHLLSIPSEFALPSHLQGEALRQAIEEALVALIALTTKIRPMVLVLEDWHWSDPASRSALQRLLPLVPSHRLMLVVSNRPGYGLDLGRAGPHTAIRLDPLDEAETEKLVEAITGARTLPDGFAGAVHRSAEGNPLFIEEACFSLLDSGVISVRDGQLATHRPVERLLLPDTVQAVIRARLDRLDETAREVASLASVIGRTFDRQVLGRIYRGRAPLEEMLEGLCAEEIIRRTRLLPEPEYSFRHVLGREVAYDTLLHQQRRQLHEAVGRAIEEFHSERLEEQAAILAYHFRRSSCAEKAVHYALLAGDQAARLYANAEGMSHFEEALTVARSVPDSPEARRWQIDAILKGAAVHATSRDIMRDRSDLHRARELAETLDDRPRLARVLYWLGRNHYLLAELEPAIEHAQRSAEIADQLGDPALAAPPVNLMGRAYWQLSDFVRSALMTERSVGQMCLLGERAEEATAAGFLSALLGYMGEFDKALSYSDRALALARDVGHPYAEAAGLHYRGIIHDQQGQWSAALADYAAAESVANRAGDAFRVYLVKLMEGRARAMAGDPATGRRALEESVALSESLGTTFLLGQAKSFLATCLLAQGDDPREAETLCGVAVGLARRAGDRFTEALALRTQAECMGMSRDPERGPSATGLTLEAIEIQERIGARPELARSYVSLARLLAVAGRDREAQGSLESAIHILEELGLGWGQARAERALAPSRSETG